MRKGEITLKRFLECGKIVSTHGVKGEVRVYPYADSPEFITQFDTLYFDRGQTPVRVSSARVQKGVAILSLEGYHSVDAARVLRGRMLYVDRDAVPMEPGEYFIQDLMGLEVANVDTGEVYGTLTEVSPTGANDVYHITFADGSVRLIPAIEEVILSVDVEKNRMEIRPLVGLFDDEN